MRQVIVASRYAKSLLLLAGEKGVDGEIYENMKLVADTCDENRDLDLLLKSPIVKADKKISILEAIFKGKLNEISLSFVRDERDNQIIFIVITFNHYLVQITTRESPPRIFKAFF